MPTLRPFQSEDVSAVLMAHETHQCVLGRGATGLGKAVELAALAKHYSQFGRVMVLVDVTKLVRQLAETIKWFTGISPGIEMGEFSANNFNAMLQSHDKIVVSTVQTQYSGKPGEERFTRFNPSEFSACLLDECELFLAPKSRSVVEWYRQNHAIRVYGCTATPFRTDGKAMANLFTCVAFDRDILWGIREGWLVPGRQAFVRVSLDFSTLKIVKGDDGDRDYSESEIADRINNETTLIELAKGIIEVAEDRQSIIVCPDVATAKAVADYLCAQKKESARCVYGTLDDDVKEDVMNSHQRGDFQFLSSVMMLTKGYNDPTIRAIFNCRKTKSRRLYSQILGRGTRPLAGILDGLETAAERKAAIDFSDKPDMLMVNMVGISDTVRDVTLVDILGQAETDEVQDRARELEQDGMDTSAALEQARAEVDEEQEANRMLAEDTANENDRSDEMALTRLRGAFDVGARVDVEYVDGLGSGGGEYNSTSGGIDSKVLNFLRSCGLKEPEIARLTPDAASDLKKALVHRRLAGLCTWKQGKILQRAGYSREEVAAMRFEDASIAIDAVASNRWKRPTAGAM